MAQFLNVVQHDGVQYSSDLHYRMEDFEGFLFNLNQAVFIYFNHGLVLRDMPKNIQKWIRFELAISEGASFTLFFTEAGMGEYHRYKRQIEEFVIGCDSKKPKIKAIKQQKKNYKSSA